MTKTVFIGKLGVGGKNPVRIKGMLKTRTSDLKGLIAEARLLEREGCEALRLAVKDEADSRLVKVLKQHIKIPLVADIHFQYKLALAAIDNGFDSVRLNPLNIFKPGQVREVALAAKCNKISIRVGINSGGFKQDFSSPQKMARAMVKKAAAYLNILEKAGFFDIMVSLKGSDTASTVAANRLFAEKFRYPLHLGVTATGPFLEGITKSSVGLGVLLSQGIGSVIRVSLTAPSFWEIRAAKYILQACGLKDFGVQVVSCPTCSRCEVDLIGLVDKFKANIDKLGITEPMHVALMGCVVNGPGEAYQADIGAAFGKKKAAIFKKDKILGWSSDKTIIKDLTREVKRLWQSTQKI